MKKLFALILAFALCAVCAAAAAEATVTVTASATVQVAPDQATMMLGVVTRNADAAAAAAENAARMNAVLEALEAAGLAREDLTTSNYSVNGYYVADSAGEPAVGGYEVTNTLRVVVRDVDQVGALLDVGLKAGANQSYGISYQSSLAAQAGDEALAAAMAEGRRKAEVLAGAAGAELGSLVSVTESYSSYQGRMLSKEAMAMDAEEDAGYGTALLPDGVSFSTSLVLVYALK